MSINLKKILDFHLSKDRSMERPKRFLSGWRGDLPDLLYLRPAYAIVGI